MMRVDDKRQEVPICTGPLSLACVCRTCGLKESREMKQIKDNMLRMGYFVVILSVAFAFTGRLFVQKSGHVEQEDFFEMPLEELMTIEVS
jgi:hypothetical protein